ncbi:MAG: hypothetical protein KBI25_05770 [Clostridia bacterium]|nr:hypothetical protein [Clostridia bacterium]
MANLYKVDRHVLGHLDSSEFRIDTRVSTKEIKKDYFNMIDSNLSIFYCSDLRANYHKIASNSVQRAYNDYGEIVDINNNIKAIQIVAGNGRNGVLNKLIYVQSVLRRGNLDEISKKISKNIAELRRRVSE